MSEVVQDVDMTEEQQAVARMLDAATEQEENEQFNHEEPVIDAESSEKIARLQEVQNAATAQLAGYALLMVQGGLRLKFKNPEININPELQKQIGMLLPDVMAEWGVSTPDFLDKYAATMALGLTIVQIGMDTSAQNMAYKKKVLENKGNDDGKETD